jgi:hypothetical protein
MKQRDGYEQALLVQSLKQAAEAGQHLPASVRWQLRTRTITDPDLWDELAREAEEEARYADLMNAQTGDETPRT